MDCCPPVSSAHGISQARVLEWGAIFFSRGSSQLRDWTQMLSIAGGFFTNWATREAQILCILDLKKSHLKETQTYMDTTQFEQMPTHTLCGALLMNCRDSQRRDQGLAQWYWGSGHSKQRLDTNWCGHTSAFEQWPYWCVFPYC